MPMNILLVEDSPTLRYAMEAFIKDAGHKAIIAENGEKAVQLVDPKHIDMIIMDVEMPGLNGFETTKLIRETLAEHWIPIIFVTGKSDEKSLEQGIAVGGDDYLIKPVSKVILQAKMIAMSRIARMRSQMQELNLELTRLSQRDSLTQLYNRRTFDQKSAEAWRVAARQKQPLSVLLLDIDFFKRYNDLYGHIEGDTCIQHVADTLRVQFNRAGDVVARYGGEEFIVLLPNTSEEGAYTVAERIRLAIETLEIKHEESDDFKQVTVSVGGCTLRYTTGAHFKQVVDEADKALYESKAAGRNCTHINNLKNIHSLILIDQNADRAKQITESLSGHCEVIQLLREDDVHTLNSKHQAELILISIEDENDEALNTYKKLQLQRHTNIVPLLIISPLERDRIRHIGKELGANGSLQLPQEQDKLIAKIDQFLGAK